MPTPRRRDSRPVSHGHAATAAGHRVRPTCAGAPRRVVSASVTRRVLATWLVLLAALVGGGLGAASASASTLDWSTPVAPPALAPYSLKGKVTAIACPSTSLCVAVTALGGIHTSPGVAGPWTQRHGDPDLPMADVACPSATMCVAISRKGVALGSDDPADPASWRELWNVATRQVGTIACSSTTLCIAAGWNDDTMTFLGGSLWVSTDPLGTAPWSRVAFQSQPNMIDASCTSDGGQLCMVTAGAGFQMNTTSATPTSNSDWSVLSTVASASSNSLSCATYDRCWGVTVGGDALATRLPGVFYSTGRGFPADPGAQIECPKAEFCVEITTGGTVRRSSKPADSSSWETTTSNASGTTAIGCVKGTAACAIGTSEGRILSTPNAEAGTPTWSTSTPVRPINVTTAIACATAAACATVDEAGHFAATANLNDPSAWSTSQAHPANRKATAVDCPSTDLCVVGYKGGDIATVTTPFATPSFTVRNIAGAATVTDVSCPTATFCAASTDTGAVVTSTAPTTAAWTARTVVDGTAVDVLDCFSATSCTAFTHTGRVLGSTDPAGGTWSTAVGILNREGVPTGADCISATECILGTSLGQVGIVVPLTATAAFLTDLRVDSFFATSVTGVSCTTERVCVVVAEDGRTAELAVGQSARVTTQRSLGRQFSAVSCGGLEVCVAASDLGDTLTGRVARVTATIAKVGPGVGTVTSIPGGVACGNVCTLSVPRDMPIALIPAAGFESAFDHWNTTFAACEGTGSACTTIGGDTTYTATFRKDRRQLTVTRQGPGTVTSAPAGIACGVTCQAEPDINEVVTLTATPDAGGHTFTGWSGDCTGTATTCKVTMNEARSVTATFRVAQRTLTVSTKGKGTVTSAPGTIDCGAACAFTYDDATLVTLTATPAPGEGFTGWSGACAGGANPCTVTMNAAKSVTASFTGVAAPAPTPEPVDPTPTTPLVLSQGGGTPALPAPLAVVVGPPAVVVVGPPAPTTPIVRGAALSSSSLKVGRSVTFSATTSEVGTLKVVIAKSTSGRRSGKRCKPLTAKNRKGKRCTIRKVVATLTGPQASGKLTIAFNGKVGKKALAAGRYQATITVVGTTGLVSQPTVLTFKVKASKKARKKKR